MKRFVRVLSRLPFRLLAFNLLLVFLPIAGVLFLGEYEERLETAEIRDLTHQSRLVAAAIARGGTLDADAFEDVIRRAKINDVRISPKRGTNKMGNRIDASKLTANIDPYSAMKKKLQRRPEYSVWKPATNSLSASARSKGARFTLAVAQVK